ncbi:hypothetical protein [uncultured Shewanella sp.]|uniref:hypothetical protein n=1 Tax=uncultured Shewanella sp. TaxID=173975 RepID=UPI002606DA68|nr:hypothetical protein [uncultured Shewanella sp.]
MIKSKIYSAKKINYQPTSISGSSLYKSRRKAKLFFHKPKLKTSWKNIITPVLLFVTLFISLYLAVIIGARIAYFTSFSLNDQSAWMGSVQESQSHIAKSINQSSSFNA